MYLDVVMLLNFLVDFLLLLGANRLAGFSGGTGRLAAAAGLGAAYAGACLLPGMAFLGNFLWRVVSLVGMCAVAFGWEKSTWKRGGIFLLLSMALGGLVLHLGKRTFPAAVLSAAGLFFLCRVAFGGKVGGQSYLPLEITSGGTTLHLTALLDTGNTLRDPITGEQVLIVGPEAAEHLTGLTMQELGDPVGTLMRRKLPGLRLIPYRCVGENGGMLLAMRFSDVTLGDKTQSRLVAFAPAGMEDGMFQALAGGCL